MTGTCGAAQAPESGPEASLFRAVRDIMEESAQSLRLTRLSGKRDMSTLLSQSAFSVRIFACSLLLLKCSRTRGHA